MNQNAQNLANGSVNNGLTIPRTVDNLIHILPSELIHRICFYMSRDDLLDFCLVSRRCSIIGREHLFKEVKVDLRFMDRLDRTLGKWPNAGARVQYLTINAYEADPPSAEDLEDYPDLGSRYDSGVQSCANKAVSILCKVPGLTHLTLQIHHSVTFGGSLPLLRKLENLHICAHGPHLWHFDDYHKAWLDVVAPGIKNVALSGGYVSASFARSRPALQFQESPAEIEIVPHRGPTLTVHLDDHPQFDDSTLHFVRSCSGVENIKWAVEYPRPLLRNGGGNGTGNGGQMTDFDHWLIQNGYDLNSFQFERVYLAELMHILQQCSGTLKNIELSHQNSVAYGLPTGAIGSFAEFSRLENLTIPASFLTRERSIVPALPELFLDILPHSIQSLTITADYVTIIPQLVHFVMAHRVPGYGFSNFTHLTIQIPQFMPVGLLAQIPSLEQACNSRGIVFSIAWI